MTQITATFRDSVMVFLVFAVALFLTPMSVLANPQSVSKPVLPQHYVDTAYVPPSGRTLSVRRGGNFQAALNAAKPGDIIELEAGATFTGPFVLPVKPGSEWIVVRSSAAESRLPAPGTRVNPTHAGAMPKLVAASGPVIVTTPGAHHYRFIGIEIRLGLDEERSGDRLLRSLRRSVTGRDAAAEKEFSKQTLVSLGTAETSAERLPHHIIFDRCYLHGDAQYGARRGIAMNSRHTAVIDSYLSDFKTVGEDSQAICGWNGSGPFKIVNNYLEGAGENVMFGGADPVIAGLVPADIEIRGNHFAKPLSWKIGHPQYAGTPWTVKNLLEIKNARRVWIEGNIFERNWVHAQGGTAILFTVRNQDGAAPWSVIEDVTFTNNIVRHSANAVGILGRDDIHPSQPVQRLWIENNLFEDIGSAQWGGGGRLFMLLRGAAHVVIDHNTAFHTGQITIAEGEPHVGFVFRNNVLPHNEHGVVGTGTATGRGTLDQYFPGALFKGNVIVGGFPAQYPPTNFFPGSLKDVGFIDPASRNYRLADSSPYKGAGTDSRDPGVEERTLKAATAGVITGSFSDRRLPPGDG